MKKSKNKRWEITKNLFWSQFLTGTSTSLSEYGASFIDALIISMFLGTEAIAAQGLAVPFFAIVSFLGGTIGVGMKVMCSRLLGRGDINKVNRYVSKSLFVGILISVITTILVLVFPKPFSMLLGARGEGSSLLTLVSEYIFGVGLGTIPLVIKTIISPAIQLDNGKKIIIKGTIISLITDVVFDILAIYLGWGIFGIGLATALSHFADLCFISISYFLKKDRMIHIVKPNIKFLDFLKMTSNGLATCVRRLNKILCPIVLNYLILTYGGTLAVSALSIRNNLSNLLMAIEWGLVGAVSALSGYFYGEVNSEGIYEVKKIQWKYTAIIYPTICILLLVFAEPIGMLYVKNNSELLVFTAFAIRMLGLQLGFHSLIGCRIEYLQVIKKQLKMNLLSFASQLIFIILTAFVLGKLFNVYGILSSYLVSDLITLFVMYLFYAIKDHKFIPGRNSILDLPPKFKLGPGDLISLDVRNIDEVMLASTQINLFCKGHKFDSKTSFYTALVFEEIGTNIVKYGFPLSKKDDKMIDLRLAYVNGSLVLRIMDNSPHFDLIKHIAQVANDNDLTHNIGIRIMAKAAEDIKYIHIINANALIITYNPSTILKQNITAS